MKINTNNRKFKAAAAVMGLFLSLAASLHAQGAPAPVGSWRAEAYPVTLWVNGNANCGINIGGTVVTGTCSWQANSTGGVLVLHYVTPTMSGNFPNNLYFGVTWVAQGRIFVHCGDGPNESGYMTRM